VSQRYYLETLGCPKNEVDSAKLAGVLTADGMEATDDPSAADLIVVNTCAFIEDARRESIDTILALGERRSADARVVVTGCMADRYGDELAAALPEVDQVAGFGDAVAAMRAERVTVRLTTARTVSQGSERKWGSTPGPRQDIGTRAGGEGSASDEPASSMDLLNLVRPAASAPWAYVKIAEGCDRKCGFCAIPSFRGKQRSRDVGSILAEVDQLAAREIVLVAQDLASYGRDRPDDLGAGSIVPLVQAVAERVDRVRLLYLYPSDLSDALIDAILATGVPYFDLSLQHVSKPLLRRMRRWGDGARFLRRIADIRARDEETAFRSNFIVGYPGETEDDHDQLLAFVEEAQLDWCGFFAYSPEAGTFAADLDGRVAESLVAERLAELRSMQDDITAARRDALIGRSLSVLVDEPGIARGVREAPEIDGIVKVPATLPVREFATVEIVDAMGPDVVAAGSLG
jgi:ribosomal protein S12 methylthiotransferase